jgi:hypothetical protein
VAGLFSSLVSNAFNHKTAKAHATDYPTPAQLILL